MTRGLFAEWQPRYAEHGIATFPVRGKVPAISNYLRLRAPGSRSLVDRFADAPAFGFAPKPSGIVVVDVDTPRETVLADALALYGDSPFVVRSGGGNFQAWYRRTDEGRHIRPDPDAPIDVLGDGFVVAPPSLGENGEYKIIQGSLADLPNLPRLKNAPLGSLHACMSSSKGSPVGQGQRNRTLWLRCMREAHHCDDVDDLLDVARTANADCLPPLADGEIVKLARSAWDYTERGKNRVGRQHVRLSFEVVDHLLAIDPDAYLLLTLLLRHHEDRDQFFVANAMAESMPPDGWAVKRFRASRERLLLEGFIVRVRSASSVYGAAVYAWGPERR
jgi:hypothetical protein